MKEFLDYITEMTSKEPVKLKYIEFTLEIYIGEEYIGRIYEHNNYIISRKGYPRYKLVGKIFSFLYEYTFYKKLLRYRFL